MTREMNGMNLMLLALYFTAVVSEDDSIWPYEEVKHFIKTFKTKGMNTSSYNLLSVDEKYNNLLVGARSNVFLVNLDDMDHYASWNVLNPSGDGFVKLMLPFEDRVFICWIGKQYTGSCTWKNRTNLSDAPGKDKQGNVFSTVETYDARSLTPDQNDTAVITGDGILFIGTLAPNGGRVIYTKQFKQPQLSTVSTNNKESTFYNDVNFVKSFEIGHYVYFFFRERTLECASCGKFKVSRVARICKGDRGGGRALEDIFVTFQKAKLSCDDGRDYPVSFNEIQDVWWDNRTRQFHAIFTSQPNAPASSAICIYSLSSINRVFDESSYKSFKDNEEHWSKIENKHREYFQGCKVNPKYLSDKSPVADGVMATDKMTIAAYKQLMKSDPLMADPVQPVGLQASFIKNGVRMTSISLDDVGPNTAIYTSTDRGSVIKISQPSEIPQPCLLTEMEVFPSGKKEVIKSMVLDKSRRVLYLGSHSSLTKLSLEQCHRFLHKSACISASDPYCGWDDQTSRCTPVLSHGISTRLQQNLTSCPKNKKVNLPIWTTCVQPDGNLCRCQARPCQDGGQNTSCNGGLELRLENCTVDLTVGWEGKEAWEMFGVQHGNWSVWGNWSECSAEAWAGVKNRSRTCTNPAPKRGGRPCVGEAVQYEPCSLGIQEEQKSLWTNPTRLFNSVLNMAVKFKMTSRAKGYKITDLRLELANETIDCEKDGEQCEEGKWDPWGDWSLCSGEGFQIRRRNCKEEPCIGERLQERSCSPAIDNCSAGRVDLTWDSWSKCLCAHGLNLTEGTGVMYRVAMCHRECSNLAICADRIEFKSCNCEKPPSVVEWQRGDGVNPVGHSNFGIGHVIGAALVGCVFAVLLCVAAICYVNRKKKQFNVSKTEDSSFHDTVSQSRFSTLPRENGESLTEPLSPSSRGSRDKNRNTKIKIPLRILFPKRKTPCSMDSV